MKRKFVSIMTLMSMLSVAVLSGCGKSDAGAKAHPKLQKLKRLQMIPCIFIHGRNMCRMDF